MIHLPSADQIFYLNRFAVAAIYAIAVPGNPRTVILATATDIRKSLTWYVRRYATLFHDAPCDVVWATWAPKAACGRIVERVTHCARGGPVPLDLESAIAAVRDAAVRYAVPLKAHDATMASVAASVERIAGRVEASRENGSLSAFNAEFKRRRIAAQKVGKHFPTYSTMLQRLNRATMAAAASGGASSPVALFRSVFGD